MKVTSSAVSQGRTFGVELATEDVVPWSVPQATYDGLSVQGKHRVLMQEADMMVVRYMWESGLVSTEYAQQRIAEIRSRSSKPGV